MTNDGADLSQVLLERARRISWERWAALTGLLAVVGLVIATLVQGPIPAANAPAKQITDFFAQHHDRIMAAMYIRLYAGFAFIWFLATLWSALARAEGPIARVSMVAFGAGIVVLGSSGAATAVLAAGAFRASQGVDPAMAAALVTAVHMFYAISGMGTAWMLIATWLINQRSGIFPPWVAWLGVVFALISLVLAPFAFGQPIVLYAALLTLIWMAIVSVLLFLRPAMTQKVAV
jgi:hypothetical protein